MTGTNATSPAILDDARCASHQVLIVEDEPNVRRLMARILRGARYTVHEAKDGLEALEFVQAAPESVDVVVSDIVMPRLNGVELMLEISRACPELPCILVSAYGTPQLADLGIVAPCGILTKPVPATVLLHEVRRCLGNSTEAESPVRD